jgi:hypothetical protein
MNYPLERTLNGHSDPRLPNNQLMNYLIIYLVTSATDLRSEFHFRAWRLPGISERPALHSYLGKECSLTYNL